jgi:hypothetical protein
LILHNTFPWCLFVASITSIQNPAAQSSFEKYAQIGEVLSADDIMEKIREQLKLDLKIDLPENLSHFFFCTGSSGVGKTQLAFSLGDVPIIYYNIYFEYQSVYRTFTAVGSIFQKAVSLDFTNNRFQTKSADDYSAHELSDLYSEASFHTAGLIVALIDLILKTAECRESTINCLRLLSGQIGAVNLSYTPLTIKSAKEKIRDIVISLEGSAPYLPLIYLDEVPSDLRGAKKSNIGFYECIFLRNLIRAMGLISVLSGTEASFANYLGGSNVSASRSDDLVFCKIIRKLPKTKLTFLASQDLLSQLSDPWKVLLQRTRPLFAQEILGEFSRLGGVPTEESELLALFSRVKGRIVDKRSSFGSIDGLCSQLSFIFCSDFKDVKPCSKCYMKANTIRHHYGNLKVPDIFSNDIIVSIYTHKIADSKFILRYKRDENTKENFFSCDAYFEAPSSDPLLYLVMLRDGLQFGTQRISATQAVIIIQGDQFTAKMQNQSAMSQDGRLFEVELHTAQTIVTHSHTIGERYPFPIFIAKLVVEYNHKMGNAETTFDTVRGLPKAVETTKIGLLSPPNTSWKEGSTEEEQEVSNALSLLFHLDNTIWPANNLLIDSLTHSISCPDHHYSAKTIQTTATTSTASSSSSAWNFASEQSSLSIHQPQTQPLTRKQSVQEVDETEDNDMLGNRAKSSSPMHAGIANRHSMKTRRGSSSLNLESNIIQTSPSANNQSLEKTNNFYF